MGFIRTAILRHKLVQHAGDSPGAMLHGLIHTARQPQSIKIMIRRPVIRGGQVFRRPLGDPGFFGSLIGHLDKAVTGAIGLVPGGNIARGITDTAMGFLKKHKKGIALAATGLAGAAAGGLALHGRHGHAAAQMGTGMRRRYRRMNPLNYHALKRSTRRIHAAAKIMRTVFHQAKHVRAPRRAPRGVRPQRHRRAA